MINYKEFAVSDDVAFNIRLALDYCKANNEDGLVFDKGTYFVKRDKAYEKFFSVSNHGDPGLKRICFLLDGFENFTLDGNGSEFIFKDIMFPVAIDNCKGITVKNFVFSSENTQNAQAEVVRSEKDSFEIRMQTNLPCYVYGEDLYFGAPEGEHQKAYFFDECDKDSGLLVAHATDYFFQDPELHIRFSETKDGLIRADGVKRQICPGNILIFTSETRCVSNIFINESKDTSVSDVTLYSGIGMGVIAQNSDGIDIDRFSTRIRKGRNYSINADGTHFVHCKGKISVRNSFFEGQLDDALNVHGIYLKITEKTEHSLMLKFMHPQTKGIDTVKAGSVIQISDADSLIPYRKLNVTGVNKINFDYLEVFVDESTDGIKSGDVADEISYAPEVLFENCTVRNNRARGMLLASAGKTIIRNNLFQTPGSAIKFESDGKYWYESGGVKDVTITGNIFENCNYSRWGVAVIVMQPREKIEDNKYFHGRIEISDNTFKNTSCLLVSANNTENLVFQNNKAENCTGGILKYEHCDTVDIQK